MHCFYPSYPSFSGAFQAGLTYSPPQAALDLPTESWCAKAGTGPRFYASQGQLVRFPLRTFCHSPAAKNSA